MSPNPAPGSMKPILNFILSAGVALAIATFWPGKAPGFSIPGTRPTPDPVVPAQGKTAPVSTESLLATLDQALAGHQSEKARKILDEILQDPRLEANTLLQIGVHFAQQEFYDDAARAFARCARDYPKIFEAHYNLALAEFARQRYAEALGVLENAPQGSRDEEAARRYLRGKIQEALGRPLEAEGDLEAAFAEAPQQENYALDLGLLYVRERAYSKASEVFERGTGRNPRSPYLWLGLSLAQFLGGQNARSIQACEKLLALEPDFSPARLLLAFVLYMDGKLAQAEKVAGEGLTGPNPHPYLYYLHSAVLLKLHSEDYDRMLRELAVADRTIPACTLCSLNQGKIYQARGDSLMAIAALERAVKLDPEFSEAWYHLAPLYERVGRPADAEKARARFRELKTEKSNRETETLRRMFLETLVGAESPQTPR